MSHLYVAWSKSGYPLVNLQKAIENCHLVRGFTHLVDLPINSTVIFHSFIVDFPINKW